MGISPNNYGSTGRSYSGRYSSSNYSGYGTNRYGYNNYNNSTFTTAIVTNMMINNILMRQVLNNDDREYYSGVIDDYSHSFKKVVLECLGMNYCLGSFMMGGYASSCITQSKLPDIPTHLYELYHNKNKLLGTVFYESKYYTCNESQALRKNLAYTTSQLTTQTELNTFLSTHNIVPNTTNIVFPVKVLEYNFEKGVFSSYIHSFVSPTINLIHTDKSVLQRAVFYRSLLPGTTFVGIATIISLLM